MYEETNFDTVKFILNLVLRLGGIKQKKCIIHKFAEPQDDFFCFIPLKPQSQV